MCFEGNEADQNGGGVHGGTSFLRCTFIGNDCDHRGGGARSSGLFVNCRFYHNISSRSGGGLSCDTGAATCVNCLIDGNQVGGAYSGAGVFGSCTLIGCTLVSNVGYF